MEATILSKNVTFTLPPVITVRYQDSVGIGVGESYTELLALPLFALNPSNQLSVSDSTDLTWKAYVIDLISASVSCSSDKFTAKLIDKNDIAFIDTIDEVYSVADISKSDDRSFIRYSVQNFDTVMTNKLYLHIKNDGAVATGPISFEIIYTPQKVSE